MPLPQRYHHAAASTTNGGSGSGSGVPRSLPGGNRAAACAVVDDDESPPVGPVAAAAAAAAAAEAGAASSSRTKAASCWPWRVGGDNGGSGSGSSKRMRERRERQQEELPMTPVVTVLLWATVAIGVVRGYTYGDNAALRQAPSYVRSFSGASQAFVEAASKSYCAAGIYGLPWVISLWEFAIQVLPLLVPPLAAAALRRWGRRLGISVGCVLLIAGQVILASAVHVAQLFVGDALARIATDLLYLSVGLQDVEMAPRWRRGRFLMCHFLGVSAGVVLAAVLGFVVANQGPLGWRLVYGVGALPPLAVLFVVPWLYETPSSLIERGRFEEGWAALREVRGPFYDGAAKEYADIVAAAANTPSSGRMFLQLLTRPAHRPALLTTLFIALSSSFLNPLKTTQAASMALRRANYGVREAVFISNITMAGAYALGSVAALVWVDRPGRLPLLRWSAAISIAALVPLAAYGAVVLGGSSCGMEPVACPGTPQLAWAFTQLAMLGLLSVTQGLAWISVAWIVIIESQSLAVRGQAFALAIVASGFGTLAGSRLLCKIGVYYFCVCLVLAVLSLAVALWLVPETARAPLEAVPALWQQHPAWRKLVPGAAGAPAAAPAGAAAAAPAPGGGGAAAAGGGGGNAQQPGKSLAVAAAGANSSSGAAAVNGVDLLPPVLSCPMFADGSVGAEERLTPQLSLPVVPPAHAAAAPGAPHLSGAPSRRLSLPRALTQRLSLVGARSGSGRLPGASVGGGSGELAPVGGAPSDEAAGGDAALDLLAEELHN